MALASCLSAVEPSAHVCQRSVERKKLEITHLRVISNVWFLLCPWFLFAIVLSKVRFELVDFELARLSHSSVANEWTICLRCVWTTEVAAAFAERRWPGIQGISAGHPLKFCATWHSKASVIITLANPWAERNAFTVPDPLVDAGQAQSPVNWQYQEKE